MGDKMGMVRVEDQGESSSLVIGYDPGGNNAHGLAELEVKNGKVIRLSTKTFCTTHDVVLLKKNERITLEADPTYKPSAVYDLRKKIQNQSMSLARYNITQVGLKVIFSPTAGSAKEKNRSIDITFPNSVNLKQDGRDLIIRKMLAESCLEPKEDATEDTADLGGDNYKYHIPETCSITVSKCSN
jgi:hypothetical protein